MIEVLNVDVVDGDGAALDVVEAADEVDDGAFAGAGGADDGEGLAGFDAEGEVFDDPVFVFVGKPDVFEFDGAVEFGGDDGGGGVLDVGLAVE